MVRSKQWKQLIYSSIKDNLSLFIFVILLLCMGIFFGAIVVNSLDFTQKQDLNFYLTRFFGQVGADKMASSNEMFFLSYTNHLKTLGLLWLLGLSIIGIPIIILLLFLKGMMIGFTVGLLVSEFSLQGFLISLGTVLPQNIIIIPAMVFMVIAGISFSIQMIRNQFTLRKHEKFSTLFTRYTLTFLFLAIVFVIPSWYEAFVSPEFMKQIVEAFVK